MFYMFKYFRIIFLVLMVSSFCRANFIYAQVQDEEEVFFLARKSFEDAYYEVSIGLLKRYLNNFPEGLRAGDAELLLAEALFLQNKLPQALERLEALLDKPSAERIKDAVLYWIAETYFKANNFPKAAEAYRKVIDGFPNSSYAPLAVYSLGWSLFEEGKFNDALGYFKLMEEKYPKEPQSLDASFKAAECLYNLKDYAALKEKVKPLLKSFSQDKPRLAYLYFFIAESEYYLDNIPQAVDLFKKAIKESSDINVQFLSRLGMGWSYLKLKDYKKAEDEFMNISEEGLDNKSLVALLLGKADTLLKQGRLKEASEGFQKVAEISDDNAVKEEALIRAGDIFQDLNEYGAALDTYKGILASFPDSQNIDYIISRIASASYYLSLDYFQREDYDSSLKVLEQLLSELKGREILPEAAYLLGSCYYKIGDFSKAIEFFKDVVSRSQDPLLLQKAEYAMADSFYHLGKEAEALSRFNALRSRYPGSDLTAGVVFWLGGYYYQQDEMDLAARYFLSLIEDFPKSALVADAYYSMGLISSAKGLPLDAAENFKKALEHAGPELKLLSMFALAESLESGGRFEQAIEWYTKASRDDKFKERALLRIARIYEDRESFRDALRCYKQAILINGNSAVYAKERADWIESNIKK
ncbi:MAG: tol-pal system protein YbgF [Candidatus Omnitrophica bacterium ADurb.Bin205]|nr:MAG: tol-pal system protein YbgF [Candidatus Omnitrophica bacterium ADurb.Bin205]